MDKARVYFETFGCTSNHADTEIMKGLINGPYRVVDGLSDCDLVIVNSCAVIEHTQRKVLKYIHRARGLDKKIVLAGCLSKIDPESLELCQPDAVVSPDSIGSVRESVDAVVLGVPFTTLTTATDKPSLRRAEGRVIAAIPIAQGCLGSCSYCATRFARGRLRSYPAGSIVRAVAEAVHRGSREIQLTAQDTGVYGLDKGSSLPELIHQVCAVEGDFRVRVGMMNPAHIMGLLPELIDSFKNKKVYKFLHLPLQSGDDGILKHMHRRYSVAEFMNIVDEFKTSIPGLTLSTDVIVGYPLEDEASFSKTMKSIQDLRPDVLNITRFSPRPRTPAAGLKDMLDRVKKERSRRMSLLAKEMSLERNKGLLNTEVEVLITEPGRNGTMLGRTDSYKQVVLNKGSLGETKKVRITEATPHYLIGED